jgi:hypothetical protein
MKLDPECPECGADGRSPTGDLRGLLDLNRATHWPDAIGCGAYPLLIVSERVAEAWGATGDYPAHRIEFIDPIPTGLRGVTRPEYFWIDGSAMPGARLDFEASGYVGVHFCSTCGRRMDDISKTYDRQHSGVWPYAFVDGSWNGAHLFTTDLSPGVFFCSEDLANISRQCCHTNLRFTPIEQGALADWSA